ncbi:MAG: glycosyltransferase [Omnitrophica WOR_2 bacterium]|jgi:glycosyltransferase involved in cell wall biosynthesis
MKRKVVIIGSAYPLRGGGITTFNERLAKAYQDNGDQVVIYTFSLQYPGLFFPGTTQYSKEPPPEGLDIRITINSINPVSWYRTANKVAQLNPDLIIIRYWIPFMAPCLGTIARLLKHKSHAQIVSITDNIIPHEKRIGDKILSRYFIGSVDGFVAMSTSVLNDINQFNKNKPRYYYPHPLYDNFGESISKEEAISKLELDPNYSYILFFGFIRDYKGLDLLLESFSSERLSSLPIKLLIAGEFYGNEDKYLKIIEDLNIGNKIELKTRFIPNTDVYLYFCASSVVVQPYKHATQSGVTQIAYHFGKPMITTNVGGLSEIVIDGKVGFVVSPTSDALEEAIFKFFSEKREAEFSNNVKTERERFSWEGLIAAIDKV